MIRHSVGKNGTNRAQDVRVIQQIINLREDLRQAPAIPAPGGTGPVVALAPAPPLVEDGVFGAATQAHIDRIEDALWTAPLLRPDSRIEPFDFTLRCMWPLRYGFPTGLAIRGTDSYGAGHHGAPRGTRTHDGTDYVAIAGQQVKAPMSGVVTRISKPYSSGVDAALLSGVEIESSDGSTCQVWYLQPPHGIVGKVVRAGTSVVGVAVTLKNRYPNGITDHVHVRIRMRDGRQVNPATVIR